MRFVDWHSKLPSFGFIQLFSCSARRLLFIALESDWFGAQAALFGVFKFSFKVVEESRGFLIENQETI